MNLVMNFDPRDRQDTGTVAGPYRSKVQRGEVNSSTNNSVLVAFSTKVFIHHHIVK